MMLFITALTAIQLTDLIVLGSVRNEIFHLMNSLVSITVGAVFGANG